jgi:hypothetical protein
VVVSLSKFKYGNKVSEDRQRVRRAVAPLNREIVEEEVAALRECIDEIHDLLADISDLSFTVQDRIGDLENSITVLEEEL